MQVVGIGNRWRGDDAAGLLVAGRLASHRLRGVNVVCCTAPDPGLIDTWQRDVPLFLVDAVISGAPPGTVRRLDLTQPLPAGLSTVSSHTFDLAAIVALARILDSLPHCCLLFGIEVRSVAVGDRLTPSVRRGISRCVSAILDEIAALGIDPIASTNGGTKIVTVRPTGDVRTLGRRA